MSFPRQGPTNKGGPHMTATSRTPRPRRTATLLALVLLSATTAACSSGTTPASATNTSATTTSATTTSTSVHRLGGTGKHHGARSTGAVGTVVVVGGSQLRLKVHGSAETVTLRASTLYRRGRHKVGESALVPGEKARVSLVATASTPTAKAVTVLASIYAGTVTAIIPNGFDLDSANNTLQAVVTNTKTAYREGANKTTSSALKSGEAVRVAAWPGTGTSLLASRVMVRARG